MIELRNRRAGIQPLVWARVGASATARGVEAMTTRAVAPFWRASTNVPSTVIVRATFIAAGSWTSTSVTTVLRAVGYGAIAGAPPAPGRGPPGTPTSTGTGPPPEMTISRLPRSSSWAPQPFAPRSSEPTIRGSPPPAATANSRPCAMAKIVVPSVLTMSGSSTPSSWLLVVEYVEPAAGSAATGWASGAEPAGAPSAGKGMGTGWAIGATARAGIPWVTAKWRPA